MGKNTIIIMLLLFSFLVGCKEERTNKPGDLFDGPFIPNSRLLGIIPGTFIKELKVSEDTLFYKNVNSYWKLEKYHMWANDVYLLNASLMYIQITNTNAVLIREIIITGGSEKYIAFSVKDTITDTSIVNQIQRNLSKRKIFHLNSIQRNTNCDFQYVFCGRDSIGEIKYFEFSDKDLSKNKYRYLSNIFRNPNYFNVKMYSRIQKNIGPVVDSLILIYGNSNMSYEKLNPADSSFNRRLVNELMGIKD